MRPTRLGVFAFVLLAGGAALGGVFGPRALAGGSRLSDQLRLYTAIVGSIEENYAEEVKSERLVSFSIREMLRTLDPHSNFFEAKEYTSLQERQKGQYYGLGITVQSVDGNITVVSPFEGTPAHRLGIRAGDVISRIEAEDARGMTIDDAVKRLRGAKGTPVNITILRQDYEEPLEFTVIRDAIPLHSVPYSFMVSKTVGYVRLTDFNETTACRPGEGPDCERELERALKGLQKKGATSVLLDVRDNPGGLLDQSFAVSNLFLKKGQLVVFTRGRTKRDESNYITESESPWVNLPLVVLTSRHSASASEIVAGAIQDHDRGLLVGETTFGKGLVQRRQPSPGAPPLRMSKTQRPAHEPHDPVRTDARPAGVRAHRLP
jgi:carboxyl-terminal processing protease